jgi:L-alanine-DL-glutamate epimerase-like enolase superfamily enzyme
MINWLKNKNVYMVEQPLPVTMEGEYEELKNKSPIDIFGDESVQNIADVRNKHHLFHGVNVKLIKTAGVTGGIRALRAARQAGLKTMIGCMIETSILISAAAHLAALSDYLDLDGNLLITNDPYQGVTARHGALSFGLAQEAYGLRVRESEL